jgi:hypothetical protein
LRFAKLRISLVMWLPAALFVVCNFLGCGAGGSVSTTTTNSSTGAAGHNFYVATSGSDSNSGSQSSPWRTISHAASAASAGMTIHVGPGTYNESVHVGASGTSSSRIVFVCDTKWSCTVNAPNSNNTAHAVWYVAGAYVDISGFQITGAGSWSGVLVAGSYDRILNNQVYDVGNTASGSTGGEGIGEDSYSIQGTEVSDNVVHDIAPYPASTNLIHGIYAQNPAMKVTNNLVYHSGGDCITSWHAATNLIIVDNTVFACNGSGILVGAGDAAAGTNDNSFVADNIVRNSNYGITQFGSTGPNNRFSNNLVFQNVTDWSGISSAQILRTVSTDPLMVNYQQNGTGDYHLQSSSPAINTGTSTDSPATDLDGYPRPYNGAWDIGAYEWHP